MKFKVTFEITGDFDEEAMTVNEKLGILEDVLEVGCTSQGVDYNNLILEEIE